MDYLLNSSGLVLLLFIFYYFFLKNDTFFKWKRNYFLIGMLLVVSIPLIKIPIYVEAITNRINNLNYQEISSSLLTQEATFNWNQFLGIIYIIGVAIFSLKFIFHLISLGIFLKKLNFTKKESFYFAETSKNISPFSFFNLIIYNPLQFTENELNQIKNHEKAHVFQKHSFDTILTHFLVIILWFNPFAWLLKQSIQQNLEFLADEYAQNKSADKKQYQLTLIKSCNANFCTEITNNFYNSLIKKRIIMLHKNKSKNNRKWKFTLVIPALALFIFTFNTQVIAQEKKSTEIKKLNNVKVELITNNIDLIVDKNVENQKLKDDAASFKKEFDITLTFKGIKRNNNGEITAIKIDAKGPNLRAKFESSGNKPINPIKISYKNDTKGISIGNIGKMDNYFAYRTYSKKHKKFKGDKNNVWIHKTDNDTNDNIKIIELNGNKKIIKVKEDVDDLHFDTDKNIEINIESEDADGATKNVFIFKKDGDKTNKHKITKKGNFLFIKSDDDTPIFIIDGKESNSEMIKNMNPNTIDKIEVLKGEKATAKFGYKGNNGVIIITTKKE